MPAENVIDLVMNGLDMPSQTLPGSSFEVTPFTGKILNLVMNSSYMHLEVITQTCCKVALAAHLIPNFVVDHVDMSLQCTLA